MALLKLLQKRCICRIYCLFNCPQVNQPEAKFSCSFQELNLSLLEFEVDVKREHSLCLPLGEGAERSEAEGGSPPLFVISVKSSEISTQRLTVLTDSGIT